MRKTGFHAENVQYNKELKKKVRPPPYSMLHYTKEIKTSIIIGCGHVSITTGGNSVCTDSIKHQTENVPNINWLTILILWGETTLPPPHNIFIGGMAPAPFSYATVQL